MVVVVERKRKRSKFVAERPEERTPPTSDAETDASWAILENGVLAVETSLKVVGANGVQRPIFYDHHQQRLVCKHGFSAGRVCAIVADPSLKPPWSTCDCTSACGLSCAKTAPHVAAAAALTPPSYYDVLQRTPTVPLATGLKGHRLPGVFDKLDRPVFRVLGDPVAVLRCRHGNTTTQLRSDRAQDRRDAAHLIAVSLKIHLHAPEKAAAAIHALVALRAVHAAAVRRQRARQGKVNRVRCSCTPVFPPRHVLQFHAARPTKRGEAG